MRAQETISQGLVFSQKSQQQVLGLYIRRAELAGFIPRKKDYTPRFFCITLEHKPLPPDSSEREKANPTNAYRESLGPSLSGKPQQRFDPGRPPHHYDGLPYVLPLFPITKGTSNFPKFLFDNEAPQNIFTSYIIIFRPLQLATLIGQRLWNNFLYFPTLEP